MVVSPQVFSVLHTIYNVAIDIFFHGTAMPAFHLYYLYSVLFGSSIGLGFLGYRYSYTFKGICRFVYIDLWRSIWFYRTSVYAKLTLVGSCIAAVGFMVGGMPILVLPIVGYTILNRRISTFLRSQAARMNLSTKMGNFIWPFKFVRTWIVYNVLGIIFPWTIFTAVVCGVYFWLKRRDRTRHYKKVYESIQSDGLTAKGLFKLIGNSIKIGGIVYGLCDVGSSLIRRDTEFPSLIADLFSALGEVIGGEEDKKPPKRIIMKTGVSESDQPIYEEVANPMYRAWKEARELEDDDELKFIEKLTLVRDRIIKIWRKHRRNIGIATFGSIVGMSLYMLVHKRHLVYRILNRKREVTFESKELDEVAKSGSLVEREYVELLDNPDYIECEINGDTVFVKKQQFTKVRNYLNKSQEQPNTYVFEAKGKNKSGRGHLRYTAASQKPVNKRRKGYVIYDSQDIIDIWVNGEAVSRRDIFGQKLGGGLYTVDHYDEETEKYWSESFLIEDDSEDEDDGYYRRSRVSSDKSAYEQNPPTTANPKVEVAVNGQQLPPATKTPEKTEEKQTGKYEALVASSPLYKTEVVRQYLGELCDKDQNVIQNCIFTTAGVVGNNHSADQAKFIKYSGKYFEMPQRKQVAGTHHEDLAVWQLLDAFPQAKKKMFESPIPNMDVTVLSVADKAHSSGKVKSVNVLSGGTEVVITASTAPGHCGGPYVNSNGKIVGFHSAEGKKGVDNVGVAFTPDLVDLLWPIAQKKVKNASS